MQQEVPVIFFTYPIELQASSAVVHSPKVEIRKQNGGRMSRDSARDIRLFLAIVSYVHASHSALTHADVKSWSMAVGKYVCESLR